MCLLLTLVAAVVTSLVWHHKERRDRAKLETLNLMYWGAALMWMMDGFFRLAEGEPFLELTADDASLGLLVVVSGLIVYFLMLRRHSSFSA